MGPELTAEQAAVSEVVSEFAREEIRPLAAEADREARFPEGVWDRLADLDLTGLSIPEAYGGYDADPITHAVVNETVAEGMLAVATALSVHCLATACIAEFAGEDVREEWLPPMAEGRPVGAFALSEPGAGSNPAEMTTEAREVEGGDAYVLNGEKQWITNGQRAGAIVCFAKVGGREEAITQFLIPGDADGLSVGEPEEKLGLRASDTTALTLDGVRIPAEYRLTEVGDGLSAAFHVLTDGRIAIAAQAVGVASHALENARAYAGERKQFGGPIGDIQAVQHTLAEMATETEAARRLTRYAARRRATGEGAMAASMAKYFASEAATSVANDAVQLHGGYGYVSESGVERLYRDAKITEIYEGTTQIQKTIIARHLLE